MSWVSSEVVPGALRTLLESGSMAGMTDEQLIERFAMSRDSGAETAFAALVSRHGAMVLGVCRQLIGDPHAADDAFQAVFLVLARRAGSIPRPDLLGPWLHGVATKVARKARARAARRHRRERMDVEMTQVESSDESPDLRSFRAEEGAAVHEEISQLPEHYRRAVVLCHFEGLTHAEAARRLGCAPGTVGSLVSRAREMLRGRLARRGLSASALVLARSLEPKWATAAVPVSLERAAIRAAVCFVTRRAAIAGTLSNSTVELADRVLTTATVNKVVIAGTTVVALVVAAAVGKLAAGMPGEEEARRVLSPVQRAARIEAPIVRSPNLPGAVTQPPPWIGNTAPFDVAAFFVAPPPEQNAAPRYLEALFEFDSGMAVCFPEEVDREKRARVADGRSGRFGALYQALRKDPHAVPAAAIDTALDEYDTGFRKLDWAQQRPRCVFPTGLNYATVIPHIQAARQVGRVAELKVRRELERGEIAAALRDVARLCRLSRDLLPRGGMIVGLVSSAINVVAVKELVIRLLSTPGLTIAHCDRLLALLMEHDVRSVDAYSEGLRADYLSKRVTWHDFIVDQRRLREDWARIGSPVSPSSSIVAAIAEPVLISVLTKNAPDPMPRPGIGQRLGALVEQMKSLNNLPNLDARIARTTPEELSRQVDKLNEFYRGLLGVANAPDLERIRKSTEVPPSLDTLDVHTRVTRGLLSAYTAFTQGLARSKATVRVAEGMILVRRWQLRHGGDLPPSLHAAATEAGLPSAPADPYDGRPIRFSIVESRPTVYSIGQDGRDDGGRIDNARTPNSGDVVLRLPAH